jgi:endonuclease/exonuclease/phosphatase family metal-dependent hydrolase
VISEPIPCVFLNTHIEYEFIQAQINSMELLINKAKEYEDSMPVLLIGDFNCRPGSKPYKILSAYMRDSYLEDPRNKEDRFVSSHGFSGLKLATGQTKEGRIDYIWIKGDVQVEHCYILFDRPGDDPDLYPSDHWPIMCDISFG